MKKYFENIFVKMGVIGTLIILLVIPTVMVQNIIRERMQRHQVAVREVNQKHADPQQVTGPIITIPYKDVAIDSSAISMNSPVKYFHVLPEELHVKGEVYPEKRKRGLFDVVVYGAKLEVEGSFNFDILQRENIQANQLLLNRAFVTIGISDLKGVKEQVDVILDAEKYRCDPGVLSKDLVSSGLNSRVTLNNIDQNIDFQLDLSLNGSENLRFVPIGKETSVKLNSKWKDPSFDGNFLPTTRKVSDNGFEANWKVLHINRNYPQGWSGRKHNVNYSAFGVQLQIPVDIYQKSMRVAKYAILFIVLTFLVFFFVEVMQRILIHPIQYILVGLALVLFFTLLLSFSEHIPFDTAYWISSAMTISLVLMYCRSVMKSWRVAAMIASILLITYGFIFIIIQVQDFALLLGSLGIFFILGVTMFFSRKIEWFDIGAKKEDAKTLESTENE